MDRIRKDVIALYKSEGLSITIDTNLIETDFLHVSFNLEMENFFPYRKPSNTPLNIYFEWVKSSTFHHQTTAIDDQQTYFDPVMQRAWIQKG